MSLPPLVAAAYALAAQTGFAQSSTLEQGRLLQVLAGGVGDGVIGETGTGCGAGLAWLLSGAAPGARLVSVERDAGRFAAASSLFSDQPSVRLLHGDWRSLLAFGPFDLLVLDGGGQGKKEEPPIDPGVWLNVGGMLVMDDFTPFSSWPPMHGGQVDSARLHWLDHPLLRMTEIRVTPGASTLVGVRHLEKPLSLP
jgi:predicted O-methyltransferase YrrM